MVGKVELFGIEVAVSTTEHPKQKEPITSKKTNAFVLYELALMDFSIKRGNKCGPPDFQSTP